MSIELVTSGNLYAGQPRQEDNQRKRRAVMSAVNEAASGALSRVSMSGAWGAERGEM